MLNEIEIEEQIKEMKKTIVSMQNRMNSFVDQITEVKELQKSQERDVIRKVQNAIEVNSSFLEEYEEVQETTERIKDELTERFVKETKDVKDGQRAFMADMIKRFNSIEDYIKNERFHSILVDLKESIILSIIYQTRNG